MPLQVNVLKVMIASPSDVATERDIVTDAIHLWNYAHGLSRELLLQPIRWETHSSPQMGATAQAIINEDLLLDADLVVGIFGTRVGTATTEFVSGSVEEIKRHIAAGKPAMLYFSNVPIAPSAIDQSQWKLLQEFKEDCRSSGLYAEFSSHEQLATDFRHHLAIQLNNAKFEWIPRQSDNHVKQEPVLDIYEQRLLIEASTDANGQIITTSTTTGFVVQTNGKNFADNSPRSAVLWKRIVRNLEDKGLFLRLSEEVLEVTDEGYLFADKELSKQPLTIAMSIVGKANQQKLSIKSNREVTLLQVQFLTASEAQISFIELDLTVRGEAEILLEHSKIVELFNAPRTERNPFDFSGPAAIRLSINSGGRAFEPTLPIVLQPTIIESTQWVKMTGSRRIELS